MSDLYESVQAHAAGLLERIDRRLDEADQKVRALNAVASVTEAAPLASQYERIALDVASELDYLRKAFASSGPLAPRVHQVTRKAAALLHLILRGAGLDPDTPGLSERTEIRQAATLGRSKAADIKSVLGGFKLAQGKIAAGADLALTLVILAEVGVVLVKRLRRTTQPPPQGSDAG